MSISVDLRALDPLHYVTPERVAALREVIDAATYYTNHREPWHEGPDPDPSSFRDARVLLMALEQLTGVRASEPPSSAEPPVAPPVEPRNPRTSYQATREIVALNDQLPDDHPAKITRAKLDAMRSTLDRFVNTLGAPPIDVVEREQFHANYDRWLDDVQVCRRFIRDMQTHLLAPPR